MYYKLIEKKFKKRLFKISKIISNLLLTLKTANIYLGIFSSSSPNLVPIMPFQNVYCKFSQIGLGLPVLSIVV